MQYTQLWRVVLPANGKRWAGHHVATAGPTSQSAHQCRLTTAQVAH